MIEPIKAELVTFHVRSISYGIPGKGYERDTIEEAYRDALDQFDYGTSCQQEVWCGDDIVLTHDEFMEAMADGRFDGKDS